MHDDSEMQHWFTRRSGEVAGPFPTAWLVRQVRKGQVGATDQVSRDGADWRAVGSVQPFAGAAIQALKAGRHPLSEEEEERREQARQELLEAERRAGSNLVGMVVGALVLLSLLGGFGYAFLFGVDTAPPRVADCNAPPAAGVVWESCSLAGLQGDDADLRELLARNVDLQRASLRRARLDDGDLSYANLTGADLGFATLRNARLVGATLTGTSLAFGDLSGADLSYANLRGARLEKAVLAGARLDKAIWPDGTLCAPGSVGTCNPLPAAP
ncbi:pentapeptide repeat-containing protein [Endothiovibrio diazotrophicus]